MKEVIHIHRFVVAEPVNRDGVVVVEKETETSDSIRAGCVWRCLFLAAADIPTKCSQRQQVAALGVQPAEEQTQGPGFDQSLWISGSSSTN